MNQHLEEMKLNQLKFRNIPWITIQPSSYPTSSRSTSRPVTASSTSSRKRQELITHPFRNSITGFTSDEMQVIKKHEEQGKTILLTRVPSKLQQLKEEQMEKSSAIKEKSSPEPKKTFAIPRSDSIISMKNEEEEEDLEAPTRITMSREPSQDFLPRTADVTIEDIKQHVWIYAHEKPKPVSNDLIKPINGTITSSKEGYKVKFTTTRGERRKTRTIASYSNAEESFRSLQPEFIQTQLQKEQYRKVASQISDTFSGLRYREFVEENQMVVPEFIDLVDFRKTSQSFNLSQKSSPISKKRRTNPMRKKISFVV